jgi:GDP-mannose 6-dehydrogenase
MKIAVFGMGYVGSTAAACLAHAGYDVLGVDTNEEKIGKINSGVSPIAEPGLGDLIRSAVDKKRLRATTNVHTELHSASVAIVCVGTPSASDGSLNMGSIAEVSRQIASQINPNRKDRLTVVYRSTVKPGTMDDLVLPIFRQALGGASEAFELVYNPEFLRESVAIDDYFNPPKIVIGTSDGTHCRNLDDLYAGIKAPVFYTRFREAEMTKFVDNTFHAVKIAFANEIGRVCRELDVDAGKVHEIFVSDTKLNISPVYLRPGGAFGGSCISKDVRALQEIASDIGAHTHLIDSLLRTNEAHKHFLFNLCARDLHAGSKVLMIGLAFKANSDDLRASPHIDLARKLLQKNCELSIFDPHVEPARLLGQNLGYAYANLPSISKLLISREQMESSFYDLVVDNRNSGGQYTLQAKRILDLSRL